MRTLCITVDTSWQWRHSFVKANWIWWGMPSPVNAPAFVNSTLISYFFSRRSTTKRTTSFHCRNVSSGQLLKAYSNGNIFSNGNGRMSTRSFGDIASIPTWILWRVNTETDKYFYAELFTLFPLHSYLILCITRDNSLFSIMNITQAVFNELKVYDFDLNQNSVNWKICEILTTTCGHWVWRIWLLSATETVSLWTWSSWLQMKITEDK